MIKLVVTAHGQFASGILTSLELIAGQQEKVEAVNFSEGMSAAEIKDALAQAIAGEDEVLILSDLLGGTPFKVSCELALENKEQDIVVLSGLNLAMLLDATFSRLMHGMDDLVDKLVATAKEGIVDSKSLFGQEEQEDDFSDGI